MSTSSKVTLGILGICALFNPMCLVNFAFGFVVFPLFMFYVLWVALR